MHVLYILLFFRKVAIVPRHHAIANYILLDFTDLTPIVAETTIGITSRKRTSSRIRDAEERSDHQQNQQNQQIEHLLLRVLGGGMESFPTPIDRLVLSDQ